MTAKCGCADTYCERCRPDVKMTMVTPGTEATGHREQWQPGDSAYFEYRCTESPESEHAQVWRRSHQPVTVLGINDRDAWPGSTFAERGAEGVPDTYRVRWPDGFEYSAFEYELLTGPQWYIRPDPPAYLRENRGTS